MNKDVFKYLGLENKLYCFANKEGQRFVFGKCRKDLIDEFQLNETENLNQWFQISYFQTFPNGKIDHFEDKINIISDLKIVNS